MPFGKHGYILDTTPEKRKLADRALPARYLRAPTSVQYLVIVRNSNSLRTIRPEEFFLRDQLHDLQASEEVETAREYAEQYEPCVDWVMHPSNSALRANMVAGARRVTNIGHLKGKKPRFQHKNFAFVPDKDEHSNYKIFWMKNNIDEKVSMIAQKDNVPVAEVVCQARLSFPDPRAPALPPTPEQELILKRACLEAKEIEMMDTIAPTIASMTALTEAKNTKNDEEWSRAWNDEVDCHQETLRR